MQHVGLELLYYIKVIVQAGSGTSFACPQIAGIAACLWQAFPTKTNWEIKTAIEQSASQYLTPDKTNRIWYSGF
jgi:subtilisin family serine protease